MRSAWVWCFSVTALLASTAHAQNSDPGRSNSNKNNKEVQEAIRKFQESLRKQNATEDDKIAAVRAVAQFKHERVVDALSGFLREGPIPVRIVTARELGTFSNCPGTAKRLMESYAASSNSDPNARGVKVTILRSLGDLRAREATDFVNNLVGDKDEYVAKAAIDASGKLRQKSSVERLLKEYDRLEGKDGQRTLGVDPFDSAIPSASTSIGDVLRGTKPVPPKKNDDNGPKTRRDLLSPAVNAALQSITRQTFKDVKAWSDWWGRVRGKFKVPD